MQGMYTLWGEGVWQGEGQEDERWWYALGKGMWHGEEQEDDERRWYGGKIFGLERGVAGGGARRDVDVSKIFGLERGCGRGRGNKKDGKDRQDEL